MVFETWTDSMIPIFANSDWGFLGNLIPLVLIIGISWAITKKPREIMFIQFPLTLAFKLIFPFLHTAFVVISFAIFIMNLVGSKGDMLADIKEMPKKVRGKVFSTYDESKGLMKEMKDRVAKRDRESFMQDILQNRK